MCLIESILAHVATHAWQSTALTYIIVHAKTCYEQQVLYSLEAAYHGNLVQELLCREKVTVRVMWCHSITMQTHRRHGEDHEQLKRLSRSGMVLFFTVDSMQCLDQMIWMQKWMKNMYGS